MKSKRFICVTVLCVVCAAYSLRACPADDSLAGIHDTSKVMTFSETCFCRWIAASTSGAAVLVPLITRFCQSRKMSDTLLMCAYADPVLRNNASVFAEIIRCWKEHNPSPLLSLQRYRRAGDLYRIDTLCAILDYSGNADRSVLMRWIDAKKVLNDLVPIPGLFCRIINERPNILPIALNQFERLLEEVEPEQFTLLVRSFLQCVKVEEPLRRSELMSWFIVQFGRRGDFDALVGTVERFEKDPKVQSVVLLNIARAFQERKTDAAAITVAKAAWKRAKDSSAKKECAGVIFELYSIGDGMDDSARVWMDRAGPEISAALAAVAAVTVFQNTGALTAAAKRLEDLPESLAKDTLIIRQLLFSDSIAAAYRYAQGELFARRTTGGSVWKVRTALFAGEYARAREIMDSLTIRELSGSSELTEYRYWLARLSGAPEALAKFSTIQYNLCIGRRKKAAEIICDDMSAESNRWRLGVRIAGAQLAHREAVAAVKTLECARAETQPEYLYLLADALYRCGRGTEAAALVGRLLAEFPASLYAARGRRLAAGAEKKDKVGGSEK